MAILIWPEMRQKNLFFVILGGILLTALLLAPGLGLKKCPFGLNEDIWPGRCPLYQDQNQDQLCDITQQAWIVGVFEPAKTAFFNQVFDPEVLVVLGLLILGTTLFFVKKYLWLRYLSLAIGLIYLGFIKFSSICPLLTLQMLFLIKDRIVANLSVFLIFLLPIVFALLFGRIFCWWVCPLGAFQEFSHRGIRIIVRASRQIFAKQKFGEESRTCSKHIYFSTRPASFARSKNKVCYQKAKFQLSNLKYIILLAIILAVIFFRKPILCGLDPFGALFGHWVTPVSIIALILLIIAGLFIFRPWCKYLCPYGAILSLFSKIRIFKKTFQKSSEKNNM